ncbi:MAG: hypothetical protein ACLT9J_10840 [Agathobacter rectalis]
MTKKLLAKGLIEKYTLESNKKEVYFKLTDLGKMLFEEHANVTNGWEKGDMELLVPLFYRGCKDGVSVYERI